MKKIILGASLLFLGVFAQAQVGLENLTVEKYYVSDAADAAGSIGALPAGSVTYRFYADLLPGYKVQIVYGVPGQPMTFSTSTSFFNNEDRGATNPNGISALNTRKNSVRIDSWLSMGATATGQVGVLKTEDTNGSTGNDIGILANTDASAGIPIMTQDGMIPGTPAAFGESGITAELAVFDATSQAGNLFTTTNGSFFDLNGAVGPTSANRVLIAQITVVSNGTLHYELNIQVITPTNTTQKCVAQNAAPGEFLVPSLMGDLGPNAPPTVSITSPANGSNFVTGSSVALAATAADANGTVSSVEFLVDGASVGTDVSSPYTGAYTITAGSHTVTAVATDNLGATTTSSAVIVNGVANPAPTVNITAPANGASYVVGDAVAITADATDDISVTSVEFFVDATTSLGVDNTAPYTANYTATLGGHNLTARATDNLGAQTTSTVVAINVVNNIPPAVNVTAPANGSSFTAPAVVTITANASDADGTVTGVEFFVNNVSIGSDADGLAPYFFDWTSTIGTANITAKATDNRGAVTTSAVIVCTIEDPNALPYRVAAIKNTCLPNTFCIPVVAFAPVNDVIGYDMVLNYDATKVTPTGIITNSSDLVSASLFETTNNAGVVSGQLTIIASLIASAPAGTEFNGTGDIFCVEFTKTAAFTSVDTAVFTITDLQESYNTGVTDKLASAGNYSTFKDTTFYGALQFWLDNSPIAYNPALPNDYLITNIYGNDLSCNNQSAAVVQPDLTGNFVYDLLDGLAIDIKRDVLATTDVISVINASDAFLATKVLLNDLSFIPNVYQAIALDVNMDGKISAGDRSQINQRSSLVLPEFKQAWNYNNAGVRVGDISKDWTFVNPTLLASPAYTVSATYPADDASGYSRHRVPVGAFCLPVPVSDYAVCPLISSETYTGIMLGDVTGNYAAIPADGLVKKTDGIDLNDKVVFDIANATITNNFVEIPVSISSDDVVDAFSVRTAFNESKLTFVSVIDNVGNLDGEDAANVAAATDGVRKLRFGVSREDAKSLDNNTSLVSVRFAINAGETFNADDLSDMWAILNEVEVSVEKNTSTTGITNTANVAAIKVYPNPANGVLNVEVAEDATVELMDASGKQVVVASVVKANQKQTINVENVAGGVYTMRVYNNNFVSVQKIVINK